MGHGKKNRQNRPSHQNKYGSGKNRSYQYSQHSRQTYPVYADLHDMNPDRALLRGEVWFAELGDHPGTSVQSGCRPVMIISNDLANSRTDTIVVLPMTTKLKKLNMQAHVVLCRNELVKQNRDRPFEDSVILAEQITTIAKTSLRTFLGRVVNREKLDAIDNAVNRELGMSAMDVLFR